MARRNPHGGGLDDGAAWLSPLEVAALLRVTPEAVRAHVRAGRLHALRIGPGKQSRIRIPSSSLAAFLRDAAAVPVERR